MAFQSIKPKQLVLRCYAEQKHGQWQAFCLEFDLAAQGDSYQEVKDKIESQIKSYVQDALGEDQEYAAQLLSRKAPFSHWLKWIYYCITYEYFHMRHGMHKLFTETLPLTLAKA